MNGDEQLEPVKLQDGKMSIKHSDSFIQVVPSILGFLENERVFSIVKLENGNFLIQEGCDGWFECSVTPDVLRKLIEELQALL